MEKSMRIAQTAEDLKNYAESIRNKSQVKMKPIDLSAQADWIVRDDCLSPRLCFTHKSIKPHAERNAVTSK